MSKKKNGHHVKFPRVIHESQEPSRAIRQVRWLIPPIEKGVHQELHRAIGMIPVLGFIFEQRVQRLYEPTEGDYVKSLYGLINTYDKWVVRDPRTPKLEQDIGELVCHSLELQIPFIKHGLVDEPAPHIPALLSASELNTRLDEQGWSEGL